MNGRKGLGGLQRQQLNRQDRQVRQAFVSDCLEIPRVFDVTDLALSASLAVGFDFTVLLTQGVLVYRRIYRRKWPISSVILGRLRRVAGQTECLPQISQIGADVFAGHQRTSA
jgi:hypothetical protein